MFTSFFYKSANVCRILSTGKNFRGPGKILNGFVSYENRGWFSSTLPSADRPTLKLWRIELYKFLRANLHLEKTCQLSLNFRRIISELVLGGPICLFQSFYIFRVEGVCEVSLIKVLEEGIPLTGKKFWKPSELSLCLEFLAVYECSYQQQQQVTGIVGEVSGDVWGLIC